MKQTITQQLEEAKKDAIYYRGKYDEVSRQLSELKQKEDSIRRNTMSSFMEQGREMLSLNQQLMEVVRWHVNPETAKRDPVDDMRNRRMY